MFTSHSGKIVSLQHSLPTLITNRLAVKMLIRSNQIPASISVPLLLTFVCVAFILGDLSTSFSLVAYVSFRRRSHFLTIAWKNTLVGFYIYFIFLLFSPYLKVSDAATVVLMGIFYLRH